MSQEEELRRNNAFNRALDKLDDAPGLQRDADDLTAKLFDLQKSANNTLEPIEELTAEYKYKKHWMEEMISHTDVSDEKVIEAINNAQRTYDETARQHTLSLDAQREELNAKVNELAAAKQELANVEALLKRKHDSIAESQNELNAELCLLEVRSQTLSILLSSSKVQAKKSNFFEEQNFIKSESVRLDKIIISERAENEAIREQKSAMSKELAATEAQKRAKLARLDTLQSKLDASKAEYAREMKINQETVAEIQSRQRKQEDEILQLEQKASDGRTSYENAKKADADITNRIDSEFGSVEKLEEALRRAEAELRELDMECSGLSGRIDVAKKTIVSNDIKMTKLNESNKKFLEEIMVEQNRNDTQRTDTLIPNDTYILLFFIGSKQPLPVRGNANTKKRPHSQEQQVQDKDLLSELWTENPERPAEDDEQTERRIRAVKLFKKYFMLATPSSSS